MRKITKPVTFSGGLAHFCSKLVAEKRNIGYKYVTEEYWLKRFDLFCIKHKFNNALTKELALKWAQKLPHESPKTHNSRLTVVRHLALFMLRNGQEAYIIPESLNSKKCSEYKPHIYNNKELNKIFTKADKIKPDTHSPYRHLIIPLLLRMLYGCGLRVSEALHLRVCDVDLDNGILTILDAKFDRDRLVPMHISLIKRCQAYKNIVHQASNKTDYFFKTRHGDHFARQSVYSAFRKLLWNCRISHGGRNYGPNLHAFRHTFAVHCLKRWVKNRYELSSALPALSNYMGHKNFRGTSRYLRLTAELYPDITSAVEANFSEIIPEDIAYETN